MSIILALDTSTDACSVALQVGEAVLSRFEVTPQSHTQRLMPLIDDVLAEAGLTLSQLDAIAFGRGPGSFTGLRIGFGVVQGLAFGASLPVVPISTLQSMALSIVQTRLSEQAIGSIPEGIIAALDARMGEVYWAAYSVDSHPALLFEEQVSDPNAVIDYCTSSSRTLVGGGSGFSVPTLEGSLPITSWVDVHPDAAMVVQLAQKDFELNGGQDVFSVSPTYLRNEVSWQKRTRIRSITD